MALGVQANSLLATSMVLAAVQRWHGQHFDFIGCFLGDSYLDGGNLIHGYVVHTANVCHLTDFGKDFSGKRVLQFTDRPVSGLCFVSQEALNKYQLDITDIDFKIEVR